MGDTNYIIEYGLGMAVQHPLYYVLFLIGGGTVLCRTYRQYFLGADAPDLGADPFVCFDHFLYCVLGGKKGVS